MFNIKFWVYHLGVYDLQQTGQPINVWVNSNAESVELLLNGKSIGKKEMPRNRHLEWNVPYEPVILQAVAYKKGKKMTAAVETTGEAFKIIVAPNKTSLRANGTDACVLNISVVDKQGREVPDAGNAITFSIKGDMTIIGVGNGDPSSHEPDKCADGAWQRRLFNGKCQVILQAGRHSGAVTVEATGTGLLPGATELQAVMPGQP